ncbi:hypothetical protein SLS60_011949 [Paraconiothyrium brasiliense]|uniref:Uncharacterized protein n=1 Tax=Paraconiothyrium brasiliense TaxID=300254 RepID=A0ABR3QH07_9PLEO
MSDAPSSNIIATAEDLYTEEQKKLVNSPLYGLLRMCFHDMRPQLNSHNLGQQVINDMEAYAVEHGLYHDEDPIPPEVFKKGHIRNIVGFIDFCISDALYNNPYKVVPLVYLASAGMLIICIVIKEYVIFQATRRLMKEWVMQIHYSIHAVC